MATRLSIFITGIDCSHATRLGGMQKLLPVDTTAPYSLFTLEKEWKKEAINLKGKSKLEVFGYLPLISSSTGPNGDKSSLLSLSPSGMRNEVSAFPFKVCARAKAILECPPPPASIKTFFSNSCT